jgi:nucleotide-binding universal stress UspA family protein
MSSRPVIVGVDGDADAARDAMALGRFLAQLLGTGLETVTVTGAQKGESLGDTAAGRHAAVIVLGPTHHHALGRTLRGTARRLLAEAPCPVAVAPAGFADWPEAPLRRIGVGYEPTPEGRRALETAHDFAARAGGSLLALGAALPLSPLAVDDLRDRTPTSRRSGGACRADWSARSQSSLRACPPSRRRASATRRSSSPTRRGSSTCSSAARVAAGRCAPPCSAR